MQLEVISREPKTNRSSVPLLFVHGSCHAAWCWEENFLDYFAAHGFSSYAVSLRGHGNSEGKDKLRWASIADYVSDVAQVAERLPQKPVLIGHSLGGLVAQKYLERHDAAAAVLLAPSPVSGMFVCGTRLFLRYPFLFAKVFLTFDVRRIYGTPALVQETLFSPSADKAQIEKYAALMGQESFRAFCEMIYCLPNPKRITKPILVLGGANDAIVSQQSIHRTARAYKAEMEIFPDMAHDLMLENGWRQVAGRIHEWLEKKFV